MSELITENPFVGLRPFEMDESLLFFGRQEQTIELLQRLYEHHFVGIVGSSGCGKSSLIRAGLIPALKAGYLVNDRDKWMIPVFKPGESPLNNFATAILSELQKDNSPAAVNTFVQKIEEEGADVIIELLQPVYNENSTNIFILVDQFEELFRFSIDSKDAAKKDEAIDFVNILLELAGNTIMPVYVVITMRSDFIGDCSQFFGLPEALNKSQYLVPRPTREQVKNAIEGPIRLYGGKINPALTTRLLNDEQTVQDELPLLQHALMRTWDHEMKTNHNGELDLDDYIAIGGIEKALSKHADEALAGLNEEEKHIAELMFRALTATDQGGRKIRRPAYLDELAQLTGATGEVVYKIINYFNADKRSFLVINRSNDENNPLIDISHESLIRQWETLVGWVEKETDSAKNYLRLSEAATLNKEGKKDLIGGTELQAAVNWQKKQNPNATWAARYNNSYEETFIFLKKSKAQARKERNTKRLRRTMYGIVILLFLIVSLTFYSKQRYVQETLLQSKVEQLEADKKAEEAVKHGERSDSLRLETAEKNTLLEMETRRADSASDNAIRASKEAINQKEIAELEKSKALAKADSIKTLLDAINSQQYYATADSIAAAKSKSFTEKALNNLDLVIAQTTDTASISKLKSISKELQVGINPEKSNDKLIHSITAEQVKQVMPNATAANVMQFVAVFNKVMDKYGINTPNRIAAFVAQVAHETVSFRFLEELASGTLYEGRKDFGNTQPGDGVKYKGRGLFELPGRANYSHFSNPPAYDLINHPELLSTLDVATEVACRWWNEHGLNELADKDDLPTITKRINGGLNGMSDRTAYYFKAKQVFGK